MDSLSARGLAHQRATASGRGPAFGGLCGLGARPRRPAFSHGPLDQFVRDACVPIVIEAVL